MGLLAGSRAFADYYATSKFSFPISMASMLFLIMGMLMIFAGLLLNTLLMIMREHKY
jgi:uncharacterized integral membrane protein